MKSLCLDHLSLSDLTALQLIEVAGQLGCAAVSIFVQPLPLGPYADLVNDRQAKNAVIAALQHHGLEVGIVEPFMLGAQTDWPLLERTAGLVAELGGTINALCFDEDRARLEESLIRLAGIARIEGVRMAIESFTFSTARTPQDALMLAAIAGPDVGLTIDTLHVIRTGGSWDDFAALPPEKIMHVQLNDGPLKMPEDPYKEATIKRMPPGTGEFDLPSLIPLIPETARIAVEAPFRYAPGATPLERGTIIVDAARRLLNPAAD